jgi:hypothetical protein
MSRRYGSQTCTYVDISAMKYSCLNEKFSAVIVNDTQNASHVKCTAVELDLVAFETLFANARYVVFVLITGISFNSDV